MEVVRAVTAGFCMGVILALQKLDALVEDREAGRPIYTLGPIIHNPQVLEEYARKGVFRAESFEDIPPEATVVIRAHGIPRDVEISLRSRGVRIIDATCPKVKKAQLLIGEHAREGRFILLYGEESHPEVRGLLSYAVSGTFVFDTKDKLDRFPLDPDRRYGLAAQTTQDREKFESIATGLTEGRDRDITILQTICDATKQRQEETVRIARDVDFMVVIGGLDSGNTRRLAQVVAAQNKPCMHVETARELPLAEIRRFARIGLTAGASTPKTLIDEAHHILEANSAG
jgi:4-hydroxy-3-methylbut-2-en-1-yl diphosphate reductase